MNTDWGGFLRSRTARFRALFHPVHVLGHPCLVWKHQWERSGAGRKRLSVRRLAGAEIVGGQDLAGREGLCHAWVQLPCFTKYTWVSKLSRRT